MVGIRVLYCKFLSIFGWCIVVNIINVFVIVWDKSMFFISLIWLRLWFIVLSVGVRIIRLRMMVLRCLIGRLCCVSVLEMNRSVGLDLSKICVVKCWVSRSRMNVMKSLRWVVLVILSISKVWVRLMMLEWFLVWWRVWLIVLLRF